MTQNKNNASDYKKWIFLLILVVLGNKYFAQQGLPDLEYVDPAAFMSKEIGAGPQVFESIRIEGGKKFLGTADRLVVWDGENWNLVDGSVGIESPHFAVKGEQVFVGGNKDFGTIETDDFGRSVYQTLTTFLPDSLQTDIRILSVHEHDGKIVFQGAKNTFWWDGNAISIESWGGRWYRAFSTGNALYFYDRDSGLYQWANGEYKLITSQTNGLRIKAVFAATGGKDLVLASRNKGLFRTAGSDLLPIEGPVNEILKTTRVFAASRLSDGRIALATYGNGLFITNDQGDLLLHLNKSSGFSEDLLLATYADGQNGLWIGMNNGLARLQIPARLSLFNEQSGIRDNVTALLRHEGTLYAGTLSGAYAMPIDNNKNAGNFKALPVNKGFVHRIRAFDDQILAASGTGIYRLNEAGATRLWESPAECLESVKGKSGEFWVGERKKVLRVGINSSVTALDTAAVPDQAIYEVFHSSQSVLFTFGTYLHRIPLGPDLDMQAPIRIDSAKGYLDEMSPLIFREAFGKELFCTQTGLYIWQNDQLVKDNSLGEKLSRRPIDLLQPRDGRSVWLYSDGQLGLVEQSGDAWIWDTIPFATLQQTTVRSLLEDGEGVLWIGTDEGLYRYDPKVEQDYHYPYQVLLTEIRAGTDSILPMNNAGIGLNADRNDMRFSFSATEFFHQEALRYSHKLEGYDDDWSEWTEHNFTEYTNLPGGNYTFRVKARNIYQTESEAPGFSFFVATPWYLRTWAYVLYALAFVLLVVLIARGRIRQLQRAKQKLEVIVKERTAEIAAKNDQLQLEKQETEKQRDRAEASEASREQFFANMTHELRTPLTLILGPVEQMVKDRDTVSPSKLNLVQRNGKKLLRLINQLLDIARIESERETLKPQNLDLARFCRDIVVNFKSHASQKGLELEFSALPGEMVVGFDPEKMEKVMFNLLSNAIKFTPGGGKVEVRLSFPEGEERVGLSVKDSGAGIAAEDLPHIFDRFYLSNRQKSEGQGTGIGLALTKELVELHEGTITVQSIPGLGSEFLIEFPVRSLNPLKGTLRNEELDSASLTKSPSGDLGVKNADLYQVDEPSRGPALERPEEAELVGEAALPLLMIVEDNADVRSYVRSCIPEGFRILEAGNGRQGLELGLEYVPDLVIADLMMPEMNGYEMSRLLKENSKTSHVPIVMLTSRSEVDSRREGLESGADAYLTKPFDPVELEIRIRKLIELRRKLRETYRSEVLMQPAMVEATSMEEKFLLDVKHKVQEHLANEQFNVEALAEEMGMSRVQLHRKFKALTDGTPSRFIRKYRLDTAHKMLENKVATVAEIAYDCGFSSASYFSKCFTEEFGKAPSVVLKGK